MTTHHNYPPVTAELIAELALRYRTWGRWGDGDEAGALNEVTGETVVEAACLVQTGEIFPMAIPFNSEGPQHGLLGRVNPIHLMLQSGGDIESGAQRAFNAEYTDDAVFMPLQCGTQWDALAHVFDGGKMYNGWGTDQVNSKGASKNSIDSVASRFVGRGVLVDLPAFRERTHLDPGEPITGEDLEACLEHQGVTLNPGDFLHIRTGHMRVAKERGTWGDYVGGSSPGLSVHAASFLCDARVAAVAIDTWTTEVWPAEVPEYRVAMHVILLVNAGIHLGEMFDMEALAEACRADGRYTFLFTAPALPISGAVGSPVNPLAIR